MNPTVAEIAAFNDLNAKQKAAYIKSHPRSKFSPNHKVSANNKFHAANRVHRVNASRSARKAWAHTVLHKAAVQNGDAKAAKFHAANAAKHVGIAQKHMNTFHANYEAKGINKTKKGTAHVKKTTNLLAKLSAKPKKAK